MGLKRNWKGGGMNKDRIYLYKPEHPSNKGIYIRRSRLVVEEYLRKT